MAGFDLDTQRSYTLPGGGRGEAGTVSFDAGSVCTALPTRLLSIYAWNVSPAVDASHTTHDLNLFENGATVDIADITNGSIIVKRSTQRNDLSATYYYEVKGW